MSESAFVRGPGGKFARVADMEPKPTSDSGLTPTIDESVLTKMQLRKLGALRNSVGSELGDDVFRRWLAAQPQKVIGATSKTAEEIASRLVQALETIKDLPVPRGHVVTIRRGRGRFIVGLEKTEDVMEEAAD